MSSQTNIDNVEVEQSDHDYAGLAPTRRQLLVWTTPVIAAVSLPVHAQTSECVTPPELNVVSPAKCAGVDPQGQATLELVSSSGSVDVEILAISDDASDPNVITLPMVPATVSSSSGIEISWQGPSADATTCLPETDVTITVTYTCSNDPLDYEIEFSLVDVLAGAVP